MLVIFIEKYFHITLILNLVSKPAWGVEMATAESHCLPHSAQAHVATGTQNRVYLQI